MLFYLTFIFNNSILYATSQEHNKWQPAILLLGDRVVTKQLKKGRPRSENPMVHTAIALPRDVLEALRSEAKKNGWGVSTEIRARLLTADLIGASSDRQTTGLLRCIERLADKLARDLNQNWHEHPYALAAFKAGVAAFLAKYQPEGDASACPNVVPGEHDDPPEAIGRTHARLVLKEHAAARGRSSSDVSDDWEHLEDWET
jgi:hypothetical protein